MIIEKKFWIKAIPVLFVLGVVFSCKNSLEEIDALIDPMSLPLQTTYDAEYVYSEEGKVKNKLIAKKVERYSGENNNRIEVSEGFLFHSYDSLEIIASTLSAEKGVFYEDLNKFIATIDVELKNVNGEQLNTERLVWLQNEDLVSTNELVKITTKDGVLWGDSLIGNSTFEKYQLFKPRGELEINEEKE